MGAFKDTFTESDLLETWGLESWRLGVFLPLPEADLASSIVAGIMCSCNWGRVENESISPALSVNKLKGSSFPDHVKKSTLCFPGDAIDKKVCVTTPYILARLTRFVNELQSKTKTRSKTL